MNRFETGLKTRSNEEPANADRSRMSPSIVRSGRLSRWATSSSCSSWRAELSSTVTRAPAAASVGPAGRRRRPGTARRAGQVGGEPGAVYGLVADEHDRPVTGPRPATVSAEIGRTTRARSTCRSQATRLCATGSTPIRPRYRVPRPCPCGRPDHDPQWRRGSVWVDDGSGPPTTDAIWAAHHVPIQDAPAHDALRRTARRWSRSDAVWLRGGAAAPARCVSQAASKLHRHGSSSFGSGEIAERHQVRAGRCVAAAPLG